MAASDMRLFVTFMSSRRLYFQENCVPPLDDSPMKTASIPPAPKNANWTPMPDPIRKEEVNIQLTWMADARTDLAIKRQANLMGFETPADYLTQVIATALASNDENIVITQDGRIVHKPRAQSSGSSACNHP